MLGSTPLRALIVDDHELVGVVLAAALEAEGIETRVLTHPDADAVRTALTWVPAVVLLDLDLGSGPDGLELLPRFLAGGAAVVVVTASTDPVVLARCYDAGASGIVEKGRSFEELMRAVCLAASGEGPVASQRASVNARRRRRLADQRARLAPFVRLTPREELVLERMMGGLSAQAIADDLAVSVWTVRAQIKSVLLKLDVHSQLAAVARARSASWTPSGQRH